MSIGNGTDVMQIYIVSIFPEMVETVAEYGVVRRAIECDLLSLGYMDPRDFTDDTRRTIDDRPYGGGPDGGNAAASASAAAGSDVPFFCALAKNTCGDDVTPDDMVDMC